LSLRLALAAALLVPLAACGGADVTNQSATGFATVTIKTANGSHSFNLEIADTQVKQERGMMYRSDIPADGGMLIAPYPPGGGAAEEVNFWTKNVPVPIDFIFIRADGTIARIAENALPMSETLIPSGEPVVAILEIRGGRSSELGISAGDSVDWPGRTK